MNTANQANMVSPYEQLTMLREHMQTAPNYNDTFETNDPAMRQFRFGIHPAVGTRPGIAIAEQVVPAVEVLENNGIGDEYGQIYDFASRATAGYMEINSLTSLHDTNLGPALNTLGFSGLTIPTDGRGSRLIAATIPSVEYFNDVTHAIDSSAFEVVATDAAATFDSRATTEAMADHKVLTCEGTHMLMNISILGLVDPGVVNHLSDNAQKILAAEVPIKGTVAGLEDHEFYSRLHHIRNQLGGLSTVIFARNLRTAVTDPSEGLVFPDGVQSLGYNFNQIVRMDNESLPDLGYALAAKTVERIAKLSESKDI